MDYKMDIHPARLVEVGTKVSMNDGEELLVVLRVEHFISFNDNSWIDFHTWNRGVSEGTIKVLE